MICSCITIAYERAVRQFSGISMTMHTDKRHKSKFRVNPAIILASVLALVYAIVYRDLFTSTRTFSHDSVVWFGTFHYYIESIKNGVFPYWDPYSLSGTLFYPNISGYGLLDPTVLLCALASKIWNVSSLTLFIYFRLFRMFLFVAGSFYFFRHLTKNSVVSVLSAGILLFTITPQNNHQPMMDLCFCVPFALFLVLRLLDDLETPQRYLNLFGLALVTGVTMNVYIPALYLFNLVFFVIALFVTKRYDVRRVANVFSSPKMLACVGACLLLTTMMASPPLVVSFLDTTRDGELFAISKLVDSNNGNFKEMMASDFGGDIFFDKLRKQGATFISYGSVLSLFYPDLSGLRFRPEWDNAPVALLYMGVIPLMVIMLGAIVARSRLTPVVLAMAGLVFLATFSFHGINDSYNGVQTGLNTLFPPLRMLDMRINFSSMLSFYLCTLFSITASELMNHGVLARLVQSRFRSGMLFLLAFIVVKAVLSLTLHGSLFLSGYDTMIALAPLLMIAGIAGMRYHLITGKRLIALFLLLLIVDLSYAGIRAADTITPSQSINEFLDTKEKYRQFSIDESKRSYQGFTYFRLPFVPSDISPIQAFIETMLHVKSSLISNSFISIFTTKRYYDLFSLMPLEQQFAITGVMHPIVRFFPLDHITWGRDSHEVFASLRSSEVRTLGGRLYLEQESATRHQDIKKIDFTEMKNVPWFGQNEVGQIYRSYIPYMKEIRMDLGNLLNTDEYRVHVDRFSINDIVISVENRVNGYLLYNDGWSKYWKAYDRGQELPVVVANYNSKAVFLPPGNHLVRLVFSPTYYQTALVLYYAGLLISCVSIAVFWIREKQSRVLSG